MPIPCLLSAAAGREMKDKSVLAFYKTQICFHSAVYTKWCIWCAEHDKQPSSCGGVISRLRRFHLSQLRLKPARHRPPLRCGLIRTRTVKFFQVLSRALQLEAVSLTYLLGAWLIVFD